MTNSSRRWVHGIVSAFIGGACGALDSALVLVLVAPNEFNLHSGLYRLLLTSLVFSILSGVKTSAAYLKNSPVPDEWKGEERRQNDAPTGK